MPSDQREPRELPVVCSLEAGDLEERLAEIAEIGAEALIDRRSTDEGHLLRFRSDPTSRQRLESIVSAEARCCAFLELSLKETDGNLVLSIAAPEAGQATADALAGAFGNGPQM
jgi:hypothetical protein